MKVAILHQGCIPHYRKPFYERLGPGYVVFHGQSLEGIPAAKPPFSFENVVVRNRRWGKAIYQPVFWRIATGKYDAIIIGHEAKYISNLGLAVWFRLTGRPVLLWGFGRNVKGPAWLHYVMLKLASDYLAYTAGGAEQVPMALDRKTILNNTIDLEPEIAAHAEAALHNRDKLRAEMSLSPTDIVFLFVGRLLPEKKVDDLIYAARKLRQEGLPVDFRVISDVHDRFRLACIFRCADALVIPGYVGLAVCHAFAHGVPVITMPSPIHSPEIEYVQEGVNGLITDDLVATLREFATSPVLRQGLASGALKTRNKLGLAGMVDAFKFGVTQAVSRPKPKRDVLHFLLNVGIGIPLAAVIAVFLILAQFDRERWFRN